MIYQYFRYHGNIVHLPPFLFTISEQVKTSMGKNVNTLDAFQTRSRPLDLLKLIAQLDYLFLLILGFLY